MGPGDMSFRNLTSSASPGGNPVRRESHRRAPKLTALTLMLLGGVLLLGAVDRTGEREEADSRERFQAW